MTDLELPSTAVGEVRGEQGFYHYRQYDAIELAEQRPFTDVWRLLIDGSLPASRTERAAFEAEVAAGRALPPAVVPLLGAVARSSRTPMEALRSALSLVGAAADFRPAHDLSPAEVRHDALRLAAVLPTLVGALHRAARGQDPVPPRDDLGWGAGLLWALHGVVPEPEPARALEQYLVTTVDHGFNASTFAGRVIVSTGADLAGAVVGAIGALSGPLHGGAPERAQDLLDAFGGVADLRAAVEAWLDGGGKVYGFGHRLYRTDDPRALLLRRIAHRVGSPRIGLAERVDAVVTEVLAERKPGRGLHANVELYAGVVLDFAGVARPVFAPTFACGRVVGWTANLLEQVAARRMVRPRARYVGPPAPQPVPREPT